MPSQMKCVLPKRSRFAAIDAIVDHGTEKRSSEPAVLRRDTLLSS
jgi:hypothetical protein